MRAVILAAGDGGRLGHYTASLPKPLVRLNGRSLLGYTLDALDRAAVDDAIVVTGYRQEQLRAALSDSRSHAMRTSFVENPRYLEDASLSLLAAREACGDEPFLLVMSDHVLSSELISRLREAGEAPPVPGACIVAADFRERDAAYTEEATHLAVDTLGRVEAIGKAITPWQALDTGAFYLTPEVWDAFERAPASCELSVIFADVARRGLLFAADIGDAFWYDVDTPEDLAAASLALQTREARSILRQL